MNEEEQTGLGGQKDIPPWLQPVPEDEEEQATSVVGTKKFWIGATIGGAVLTIALFASVIWYLYDAASSGPAKHVAAPNTAYKEKPADVGGMQVAHQDKEVFNQVDGAKPRQSVELGAQPEVPVAKLPEDPVGDIAAAVTGAKEAADEPVKIETPKPTPVEAEPKPEAQAAETPAKTEEQPVDVMAGKFRIQLGAYGSEPGAKRAWVGIRSKFYEYLKEKSSAYEAVDTGGRTLYRLRVGPFDTRAEADQTCLALRAGQQACIVVNP